ncbi:MlaC/ttg2D family ABC transporter substrate-binding protein [Natronospira bacteriovora]|uniref:ABC transporter substrate-binding protein n=1 Tax=Natronospira bacteriovora TaxID=3069753 RepID=A0ABU0W354_9GAMM|nr:ABC transporter substrate-binding protein [Natronospira sp. AB-CW4]MDQ2068435.1 ABC transporter substrate-binding protein [Natronospira sp. AB-CW4]
MWYRNSKSLTSLVAGLVLTLLLPLQALAEEQMPDPAQMVEETANEIIAALQERRESMKDDPEALYAFVEDLLLPVFDVPYSTRLVLGRHGRDASPEQRRAFGEAFYRFLVRSYADGMVEYTPNDLEIRVQPVRGELNPDRTRVRTQIVRPGGSNIPVDYTLRYRDGEWRVFDVTIEGVSYVTNYRNSFDSEIRQRGLDAVIERLEERASRKADELEESLEGQSEDGE